MFTRLYKPRVAKVHNHISLNVEENRSIKMQHDFEALIQRYEYMCSQGSSEEEDELTCLDQNVPQPAKLGRVPTIQPARYGVTNVCSESKIEMLLKSNGSNQTFTELLSGDFLGQPVQCNRPVCVTDITDVVGLRGESPDLLDLDQAGSQDLSFYDIEVPNTKREFPVRMDCCSNSDTYPSLNVYHTEEQNIREMESKIIQGLKQDINATCCCLQINDDPYRWSVEDVHRWIEWQCRVYNFNINNIKLEYFNLRGADLCSLTEEEFKLRAYDEGPTLYSQLDIWKCARDIPNGSSYNVQELPSFDPCQVPALSLSPTPSTSSEDSLSNDSSSSSSFENHHSRFQLNDQLPEEPDHKPQIQLWQFLKQLLLQPEQYKNYIKWVDRASGIFKIEDSVQVAKLWGRRKKRPAMNYDKLSRSIRQYYKKGIIKKTEQSKRLVYQFCTPYL
ncbi:hypothetical protein ACJMK2_020326 [Sinanodonta woodiana]|uniref:Uncharacterized protein n=1 Tax=Sinanodonta woodiana TaxID=1069815 RepID=A0ABD3U0G1_SINWO